MQAFVPAHTTPASQLSSAESVRAAVGHLLAKTYSMPCLTAAQAFMQLVQPTSRFQLALDALLPLLDVNATAERILASFILFSLYAPHPITVNPFRSALLATFMKERERAITIAHEGGASPNEQLVWVLWKILKGDGNDIGPYSPSTLARSPLPPKLRAVNLVLDEELYNCISDLDDSTYLYFQKQNTTRLSASSDASERRSSATVTPDLQSPIATSDQDKQKERVVQAMRLLISAKDRVLTLSEQRVIEPYINEIASSRFVTSLDLTHIIAYNPMVAHPLLVGHINRQNPEDNNPLPYLDILPFLPPTLPSLDLLGRLLRDPSLVTIPGYANVADLVRTEVLGRFIHEAINWVERAEQDECAGLISDDRFAKGVQNICRFYGSLIKLSIVDASSEAETVEMSHFSLNYARFEEAKTLYRVLAMGRV